MIAVDSSTLIAFMQGDRGRDVERFDAGLSAAEVALPPIVVTEALSDNRMPGDHRTLVLSLPTIEITEGYWIRAGATRALLFRQKLRARLADTLISQACIDADFALITRDADFRHFAKHCGLKLA